MLSISKKKRLIGLDIGSRTVKAGEITELRGRRRLRRFAMAEIAPGTIVDGVLRDAPAAARTIRDLLRDNGFKERNVAIAVGGRAVIVKRISVPFMNEDLLHGTIRSEAEQYSPFDIDEVNLDFQILGAQDADPGRMQVLLVAARKEMIDEHVALVRAAGLNPCVIDVEACALQNIYELDHPADRGSIALIDIGAGKTSLNLLKQGESVFMRDVSSGCDRMHRRIVSATGRTVREAETIDLVRRTTAVAPADRAGIVTEAATDWGLEIRRAFDFFHSTYPEDRIERIVLSGGGALITEFRRMLADETGVPVEILDPFKALEIEPGACAKALLERVAPRAAICMGLALRKVDDQ